MEAAQRHHRSHFLRIAQEHDMLERQLELDALANAASGPRRWLVESESDDGVQPTAA